MTMGRNAKTIYPRTEMIKVRSSKEHKQLLAEMQAELPGQASGADVVSWALEDYARKHCSRKIKFIPHTQVKVKDKGKTGREIIIGKNY